MSRPAIARREVIAPAVVLFAIMVAHTVLETARDALFLARLGPDQLASVYLVMALLALATFAAVRRWGHARDPRRALLGFLGLAVAGTGAFAVAISASHAAVFAFYVWTGLIVTLIVPWLWTVLDRSLRVGEAKRTFAAIGAGGVLGAMVGSVLAGALGTWLGAASLVAVGAVAYAIAAACAAWLAPRAVVAEPVPRREQVEALSQRSRRYVAVLVGLGVVSTMSLTLGDIVFKRFVAEHAAPGDLTLAFGSVYAGLNALALVVQLVIAPRLLARWGVGGALTVLPSIMLATGLGFAWTGAAVAIAALEVADGGLRNSLHRVGVELLYLPVPRRCARPGSRSATRSTCAAARRSRRSRWSRSARPDPIRACSRCSRPAPRSCGSRAWRSRGGRISHSCARRCAPARSRAMSAFRTSTARRRRCSPSCSRAPTSVRRSPPSIYSRSAGGSRRSRCTIRRPSWCVARSACWAPGRRPRSGPCSTTCWRTPMSTCGPPRSPRRVAPARIARSGSRGSRIRASRCVPRR